MLAFQFVGRRAHHFDQWRHQLVEEGVFRAQHVAMADRATNDAAQHVAAVFVRRDHAVRHQEGAGTDVVGDNAQGFVVQIGCTGHFCHGGDQGTEQIDFIVGVHMLQHRRDALQAHTGIHRRFRQRQHGAVGLAVELHENDVPDLDVAVAVFFRAARRAAPDVIAVIVENLGARAAWAGVAHLPEVVGSERRALVVADADNALGRYADLLLPDVERFVIGFIHGDPQSLFRQVEPVFTGQQFPRVADRVMLEVIAEAEVTQHFKEGVVTGGIADVFQIIVLAACAHAALRGGGTGIGAFVQPQENILKLVHAGIGKQQCRIIVRHQGATRYNLVTLTMKEIEKRLTDLSGALAHNFPGKARITTREPVTRHPDDDNQLTNKKWG